MGNCGNWESWCRLNELSGSSLLMFLPLTSQRSHTENEKEKPSRTTRHPRESVNRNTHCNPK